MKPSFILLRAEVTVPEGAQYPVEWYEISTLDPYTRRKRF